MRRKQRVVWLPTTDSEAIGAVPSTNWGAIFGPQLAVSGASPTANAEVPIVIDQPQDPTTSSLSDVESSGYRLRRIVGKIFVQTDLLDDESGIQTIGVTAGLIIRKVDQTGTSLASQLGTNQNMCSPSERENITDPWIWRRSWLLENPVLTLITTPVVAPVRLMTSSMQYGSAVDGGHIDQKTARLIGPEERLFLDVSVTALEGADGQNELTNDTTVFYDFRVLGTMRPSSGNRRNASR